MTNKAQHTPGPWIAQHSGTGDASVICKCGWKNKDGTKFEPVIIKRTSWENARLIAAAPELLYALVKLIDYTQERDSNFSSQKGQRYQNAAIKAVEQATGIIWGELRGFPNPIQQ